MEAVENCHISYIQHRKTKTGMFALSSRSATPDLQVQD